MTPRWYFHQLSRDLRSDFVPLLSERVTFIDVLNCWTQNKLTSELLHRQQIDLLNTEQLDALDTEQTDDLNCWIQNKIDVLNTEQLDALDTEQTDDFELLHR